LGARAKGTERLEDALIAYRGTLKEWTRERVPLDWALTQNNLGVSLRIWGNVRTGLGGWKRHAEQSYWLGRSIGRLG
jgi:hypothetical protein